MKYLYLTAAISAIALACFSSQLPALLSATTTPITPTTATPPPSIEKFDPTLTEDTTLIPESTLQATFDPRHRTALSAEIPSPIVKINKKLGEPFNEGEVLIQLDDVIYQSAVKKANAALEKAKTELDGKKQLFQDNVASLFEIKEAESNVATAETDLSIATKNLKATTIKAPYDGKVISVDIEEHELPQAGTKLIEIVDDKVLIAKLLIPASMLSKISIGTPFKITILDTGQVVDAKISRIGSVIDPSSGTLKIEADIDNADSTITAGTIGTAKFNLK